MDSLDDKDILEAITKRIFQFIEAESVSYADFAASIDIGAAVVSHMKNGRNKVSLNVYAKILDSFPNLNPDWLLFGQGTMYRNSSNSEKTPIHPNLFTPSANTETGQKQEDAEPTVLELKPEATKIARQVKKIVIFYDDNSFQEFMP